MHGKKILKIVVNTSDEQLLSYDRAQNTLLQLLKKTCGWIVDPPSTLIHQTSQFSIKKTEKCLWICNLQFIR